MIRSIATVSIGGALDEKLKTIAAAGFDAVEIFENDFTCFDGSARDVARMCGDLGLRICALQPFRDFEGLPEPQRKQAFRRAERKFDLMQELGTDLLLVCSNVSPVALGGIDRAADDLRELGERAGARGLRVGFEALAWGRYVNDYRDAWEIVRRANHSAIGIILDSFHTLAPGFPIAPIAAIPADRIFLVQLADAPQLDLDVLSWSRHFRCFPGQGNLPRAIDQRGRHRRHAFTALDGQRTSEGDRRPGPALSRQGLGRCLCRICRRSGACGLAGRAAA
jgi:4-hydroxyphenylpyruvate dioxygenase